MTRAKTGWGGKRTGAGRKKSEHKTRSVVIRVDECLVPVVRELKNRVKAGLEEGYLFSVTNNQVVIEPPDSFRQKEQQRKLESMTLENQALKEKLRQLENQCAQTLVKNQGLITESEISRAKLLKLQAQFDNLKNDYRMMEYRYEYLYHQKHDCMAATKDGKRCSKKAIHTTIQHGFVFHVCRQHAKKIDEERNSL